MLSEKQEMFVQGLIKGLSQRKAYRAAYPASEKWNDASVDVKASQLASTDKVMLRLKELRDQTASKAVMTATMRKEWLTALIENDAEDTKDKLKAIDILNKMDGEYTEKVQLSGKVNNPFEGLTTEELRKLAHDE